MDVVLEKGMWGWRRLQLGPWVPPTAGTLPRLQTTVTSYCYIPSKGTMDKQESRCPPPGPLRLFVLTCLLVSAPKTVLYLKPLPAAEGEETQERHFSLHCSYSFEL